MCRQRSAAPRRVTAVQFDAPRRTTRAVATMPRAGAFVCSGKAAALDESVTSRGRAVPRSALLSPLIASVPPVTATWNLVAENLRARHGPGGHQKPSLPWRSCAVVPRFAALATARPRATASLTTRPQLSDRDVDTNTSARASRFANRTSDRPPSKPTAPASPSSATRCSMGVHRGPSPTIDRRADAPLQSKPANTATTSSMLLRSMGHPAATTVTDSVSSARLLSPANALPNRWWYHVDRATAPGRGPSNASPRLSIRTHQACWSWPHVDSPDSHHSGATWVTGTATIR